MTETPYASLRADEPSAEGSDPEAEFARYASLRVVPALNAGGRRLVMTEGSNACG